MKYINFKEELKPFSVFSLSDIATISPIFHRKQLTEWLKKGYIQKLKKGYYFFSDQDINDIFLSVVANKIYAPSYISMEVALSRYEFIPESVYKITSVSTRKTQSIHTPIATFTYRHIRSELMFGYRLEVASHLKYAFASAEKALLDYFYFNYSLSTLDDIEEMRFNIQEINDKVNWNTFQNYLDVFNSKQLTNRVNLFREYIKNA